jgi:hypothetical protein
VGDQAEIIETVVLQKRGALQCSKKEFFGLKKTSFGKQSVGLGEELSRVFLLGAQWAWEEKENGD